jgi:hypothetical protein
MSGKGIFISYRREDTKGECGRLDDRLRGRYGAERVFRDIHDSPPGVSFPQHLERSVSSCRVAIVVLGGRWLESLQSRLNQPEDWVRLEIRSALRSPGVTVIPVLMHNAAMPSADELPEDIRPLSTITAQDLSDNRWDDDVKRLTTVLDPLMWPHLRVQPGDRQPTNWTQRMQLAASGWIVVLIIALLITSFMSFSEPNFQEEVASGLSSDLSKDQLDDVMLGITAGIVIVVLCFAAVSALMAFGSYRGWRWVFWLDLVAFGITGYDLLKEVGNLTADIQSPSEMLLKGLPMFLMSLITLALFVWMLVGLIRFGPGAWSTRKLVR